MHQDVDERYDRRRTVEEQSALAQDGESGAATFIGSADGPTLPFPVKISALVTTDESRSGPRMAIPTLILTGIPEETLLRLSGVYIAWASISKTKVSKSMAVPEEAYDAWYQALVTVAPARDRQASVVEQKHVSAYLINDFDSAASFGARLNILLMAFLRPAMPLTLDPALNLDVDQAQVISDIATVQSSLSRHAWCVVAAQERIRSSVMSRSITERLVDVRGVGQRQLDKVPLHRLGVRMNSMAWKDQLIGTGGVCIKR